MRTWLDGWLVGLKQKSPLEFYKNSKYREFLQMMDDFIFFTSLQIY